MRVKPVFAESPAFFCARSEELWLRRDILFRIFGALGLSGFGKIGSDPGDDEFDCESFFSIRERVSGRNAVPLHESGAAAAGRGVLGGKDGMPLHRRLMSVVGDLGGGKALGDDLKRVLPQKGVAFCLRRFPVFGV